MKKSVWPNFLALSSVTNPKGQFIRIQKVFWHLVWSSQDHCYNTYEVVGNNFFFNWHNLSTEEKILTYFFFQFYRLRQTLRDYIKESARYFKNSRRIFMIICVTPKGLLKTNQLKKKAIFPARKFFGFLYSYYRAWRTSGNNLLGYTRYFDKYCATYMVSSLGPE